MRPAVREATSTSRPVRMLEIHCPCGRRFAGLDAAWVRARYADHQSKCKEATDA